MNEKRILSRLRNNRQGREVRCCDGPRVTACKHVLTCSANRNVQSRFKEDRARNFNVVLHSDQFLTHKRDSLKIPKFKTNGQTTDTEGAGNLTGCRTGKDLKAGSTREIWDHGESIPNG